MSSVKTSPANIFLDATILLRNSLTLSSDSVLIKLGCINEDELIDAYSQQMGKKPIDIEEILKANLEVTALLSEDFAKEKNIVALNKSENSIIVVMSDPEDISTLDSVKKLTNLNPEIFISGSNNIKKALDILYSKIKKSGEVESAISSISIVKVMMKLVKK